MNLAALGLAALVPAMIGPLPAETPVLIAELCNGGTIEIPLGPGKDAPAEMCRLDACHAGNCRKKLT